MRRFALAYWLSLPACLAACDPQEVPSDIDGDGFTAPEDCDDHDAAVNPAALEMCNALDDNCDDLVDDASAADAPTWYADGDGDSFGDPDAALAVCYQPDGYVRDAGDCDPNSAAVSPAAVELCNALDDNCDGVVDESTAADAPIWYTDRDGDGFGDTESGTASCKSPDGLIADGNDCDDTRIDVSPAGIEVCDGAADENCDGEVDEDSAADAPTWYADADADGFGDPAAPARACEELFGFVADDQDCLDSRADVSPLGTEVCDGAIDENCDGFIDEATAADAATWYADADADGFGDASAVEAACTVPAGFVGNADDCDDARGTVSPSASERCDGVLDDDCDGVVDEDDAIDAANWYVDADSDGYGDAIGLHVSCVAPAGYVASNQDCDDARADVSPSGTELCDGAADEDCDGTVDEDAAADAPTWYADDDADGFGDATRPHTSCVAPSGFGADGSDCDDLRDDVSPDGIEVCDGLNDEDCDGEVDEDDASDALTWYADADADTYGDALSATTSCLLPSGYSADNTDCDDAVSSISPAGTEICDGLNDEDCDGTVDEADAVDADTWYADADGDGYGDATSTAAACTLPAGYAGSSTDCNDADSGVHPGARDGLVEVRTDWTDTENPNVAAWHPDGYLVGIDADGQYYTQAGTAWDTETFDATVSSGVKGDLALDSLGDAHVCYCDAGSLYYTTNASGAWVSETISTDMSCTRWTGEWASCDIALDSAENPVIAYIDSSGRYEAPAISTHVSGSWVDTVYPVACVSDAAQGVTCTSTAAATSVFGVTLDIDSADVYSFAYYVGRSSSYSSPWSETQYLTDNAGTVTTHVIDDVAYYPAFFGYDSTGRPRAVAVGSGGALYELYTNSSGRWYPRTISAAMTCPRHTYGCRVDEPQVWLDDVDYIHAVYQLADPHDSGCTVSDLYYSWYDGSSWDQEFLAPNGHGAACSHGSGGNDRAGAMDDVGNIELVFDYKLNSGSTSVYYLESFDPDDVIDQDCDGYTDR